MLARLRRLRRRFRAGLSDLAARHPRGFRVALGSLVVAGLFALSFSALALPASEPARPVPAAPSAADLSAAQIADASATYVRPWTLAELVAHIESGEVSAVTRVGVGSDDESGTGFSFPVAILRDGSRVAIALSVDYAAAVDSLRAAGYGRLLTAEAVPLPPRVSDPFDLFGLLDAPRGATNGASGGALGSGLVSLGLMFLLLFAFWRISRSGLMGRNLSRGRDYAVAAGEAEISEGSADADEPGDRLAPRGVRLADVAGADEAKLEVTETIEFLRDPARFARLGAKVPRGLLFYGPPGTGKTMLARAVAAEAEVPFFAASGSEFVEMYVGVGAARIRSLFAQARRAVTAGSGAVIFIDELDALARRRGGANGNDERENTLNELLVAMDGFGTDERVIVIGATNRIDTLDPAVLRPGRFTRKVPLSLPDRDSRRAILDVHASGKPLASEVDLDSVAGLTAGYSGADLADLLNESAILAARREADAISPDDLRAAMLKLALGVGRRRSMPPRERSIIAAHEAGHAICGHVAGANVRIDHISLFAHGDALGVTVTSPERDDALPAERSLRARLVGLMGGRVAEQLCAGEATGGASNDFAQASELARTMVERWGLGADPAESAGGATGRGSLSVLVGDDVSPELASARERAVKGILDQAYAEAERILTTERERLERVAAYLYEHERLDGAEFVRVFDGRKRPGVRALADWRGGLADALAPVAAKVKRRRVVVPAKA